MLRWIEERDRMLAEKAKPQRVTIPTRIRHDPENANEALLLLAIAARASGETFQQLLLEPWAVQMALSRRRGGQRLTDGEIQDIKRCTRNPDSLPLAAGVRAMTRATRQPTGNGYGKPPVSTRFAKGQSGNPRGRPPGRRRELPHEAVLGQMVTVRDGGTEKRVTAEKAFLLYLTNKALEGDAAAARDLLAVLPRARASRTPLSGRIRLIEQVIVSPTSVDRALDSLRMGKTLDRHRDSARMALEPWVVEAALERLGNKRFTPDEQRTIVRATRTPWKVRWPRWWEVMP